MLLLLVAPPALSPLAQPALEPIDEVAASAELHDDGDGAASIVVAMQEHVLEAHHVRVIQTLQARCSCERRVRLIDGVAADDL